MFCRVEFEHVHSVLNTLIVIWGAGRGGLFYVVCLFFVVVCFFSGGRGV